MHAADVREAALLAEAGLERPEQRRELHEVGVERADAPKRGDALLGVRVLRGSEREVWGKEETATLALVMKTSSERRAESSCRSSSVV